MQSKLMDELLGMVLDQMRAVIKGETPPATVNAVVNGTAVHLRAAKLQMEYAAALGKAPSVPFLATNEREPK